MRLKRLQGRLFLELVLGPVPVQGGLGRPLEDGGGSEETSKEKYGFVVACGEGFGRLWKALGSILG